MCHDVRGVMIQLRSRAEPHPPSRPLGWSEKLGLHVQLACGGEREALSVIYTPASHTLRLRVATVFSGNLVFL